MSIGFKKTPRSLDFAYLPLANCLEQKHSIKLMEQFSNTINWSRVESILLSHYTVGTSEEGACDKRYKLVALTQAPLRLRTGARSTPDRGLGRHLRLNCQV
jgi:hypothetical protein